MFKSYKCQNLNCKLKFQIIFKHKWNCSKLCKSTLIFYSTKRWNESILFFSWKKCVFFIILDLATWRYLKSPISHWTFTTAKVSVERREKSKKKGKRGPIRGKKKSRYNAYGTGNRTAISTRFRRHRTRFPRFVREDLFLKWGLPSSALVAREEEEPSRHCESTPQSGLDSGLW